MLVFIIYQKYKSAKIQTEKYLFKGRIEKTSKRIYDFNYLILQKKTKICKSQIEMHNLQLIKKTMKNFTKITFHVHPTENSAILS